MLAAGSPAPDFTLQTDEGKELSLRDLRGRNVVLFFYPKDDTSGCTKEACEFRDAMPRFEGLNAAILGISPDDVKSHQKFRKKYELSYPLLADTGHAVADAYGVWGQKSFMGRKYMGNARTTFLIGPDGIIKRVFEGVRPAGHAAEVAEALA